MLGIGVALFGLMVRTLARLFGEIFAPALDFRMVIGEVLFMLVMVEVVRLLIIYLEEHRVAGGLHGGAGSCRRCARSCCEGSPSWSGRGSPC